MILKEDCSDFEYLKNDITMIGEGQRGFIGIPNCRIHKMSLVDCLINNFLYSANISVHSS